MAVSDYPRDLVGYGRDLPTVRWPGSAAVAVQFVVNFEEGGEHSVLHGDTRSESFLLEEPTAAVVNTRSLSAESQYEYGSRAGFWRLYRLFTQRSIPVTVYGVTEALERHPEAVAAMQEAEWEIACHGLRWIDYSTMPEEQERATIRAAIQRHEAVTGSRPTGWYTGRMSVNTRRLLVEQGGFRYDSDSFSDDLPYWVGVDGVRHLVIPYTLDNNDTRYLTGYGYGGRSFSSYLTDCLGLLREEGRVHPRMMSVGLHTRIAGKPGRAADLARFLDYVTELDDVWITRRIDIANHWHDQMDHLPVQPVTPPSTRKSPPADRSLSAH